MIDLEPACDTITVVLATVRDDQLNRASPCREYKVGQVIDHLDEVSLLYTAVARHHIGETGGTDTGSVGAHLTPGWRGAMAEHLRALGTAWADPAAWTGTTAIFGLELSNELWGRIVLTEIVVHGWDVAQGTGQSFDLPERTLRAVLDHVAAFVPNSPVPDVFGPPVGVRSDAKLLDQIVAITGRIP
jgi:uncharacterized protein (TIGR03086 family)